MNNPKVRQVIAVAVEGKDLCHNLQRPLVSWHKMIMFSQLSPSYLVAQSPGTSLVGGSFAFSC